MAPCSPPETDVQQVMDWLAHGGRLAQERWGTSAHCRNVIWILLEEAIHTIDRVPDQERSWLTAGHRSGGWASIVNTKWDVELVERLRLMTGMKPTDDGTPRSQPQRDDVERALEVLSWLRFCSRVKDPERLQRAAVALARGGDVEAVHRLYGNGRTRTRQVVYEIRNRVIDAVLRGLHDKYGIKPYQYHLFRDGHERSDS